MQDSLKPPSELILRKVGVYALTLLSLAECPRAQMAAPESQFEVASIRQNIGGVPGSSGVKIRTLPGGRFEAINVTLRLLIGYAYPDSRISGGPSWIQSERYDIKAKLPEGTDSGAMTDAVRRLLSERFQLAVKADHKKQGLYELTWASSDRRHGPGLRLAPEECQAAMATSRRESAPQAPSRCKTSFNFSNTGFSLKSGHLPVLIARLAASTGRNVLDRTELRGVYDIDLHWSDGPEGPSLYSAIKEQLGLKLVSSGEAVEVLTVVRVTRPTNH